MFQFLVQPKPKNGKPNEKKSKEMKEEQLLGNVIFEIYHERKLKEISTNVANKLSSHPPASVFNLLSSLEIIISLNSTRNEIVSS